MAKSRSKVQPFRPPTLPPDPSRKSLESPSKQMAPAALVTWVYSGLLPHAHAPNAKGMAAYMRTTQPFLGVANPLRQPVFRQMCRDFAAASHDDLVKQTQRLWSAGQSATELPGAYAKLSVARKPDRAFKPRSGSTLLPPADSGPRELQYAAIAYLEHHSHLLRHPILPFTKQLVQEGGWWDTVDWLSVKVVSRVVLEEGRAGNAKRLKKVVGEWLEDDNIWVRRSAILSQMQGKAETDAPWLFEMCLKRGAEHEFFIAKAIGWALRQYARTDPKGVKSFLVANRRNLQPLSIREAGKHIGVRP